MTVEWTIEDKNAYDVYNQRMQEAEKEVRREERGRERDGRGRVMCCVIVFYI